MTTESKVTIKADNVEITSGLLRTAYLIRIYKENGDRIGDIVSQYTLKKYVESLKVSEVKDVDVYRTDTTVKMVCNNQIEITETHNIGRCKMFSKYSDVWIYQRAGYYNRLEDITSTPNQLYVFFKENSKGYGVEIRAPSSSDITVWSKILDKDMASSVIAYIIDTEGSKYHRPRDFRSKIKTKILEAEPSVYDPDDYWNHARRR